MDSTGSVPKELRARSNSRYYYREEPRARPITYELGIDTDTSGRPYVLRERLRQRRKGQKNMVGPSPFS